MKIRTDRPLLCKDERTAKKVASFWDGISEGWRMAWGPHIHHGYYENTALTTPPLAAQEKLIEKLAALLSVRAQDKILDAGCGMGGSALYLAEHYAAHVKGITLSHKQVKMAAQAARENNIKNVSFEVADAVTLTPFQEGAFDIVWSLESCEQFVDKNLFIQNAFRALRPGGQLMLATWCADRDEYEDTHAKQYKKLCGAFDLPYMPTVEHYKKLLDGHHFKTEFVLDWTPYVKPSWDIGIKQARAHSILTVLRIAGWRGLRFVSQLKLMKNAFDQGRVQYGVLIATKPGP